MSIDYFTITLGLITAAIYAIEPVSFVSRNAGIKGRNRSLEVVAGLLLIMYALLNHDIIAAAGQTVLLFLTVQILIRNKEWSSIPKAIRTLSITIPILASIALLITSTYQYQKLMPVLPNSIAVIGMVSYFLATISVSLVKKMNSHPAAEP